MHLETLYLKNGNLESGRIMSEVKKCPKCGNSMEMGKGLQALSVWLGYVTVAKESAWLGHKVIPFICKNCGFVELYDEKSLKTP
jgi:predicted nucleic-acid-binding Zn-ribbon protein